MSVLIRKLWRRSHPGQKKVARVGDICHCRVGSAFRRSSSISSSTSTASSAMWSRQSQRRKWRTR